MAMPYWLTSDTDDPDVPSARPTRRRPERPASTDTAAALSEHAAIAVAPLCSRHAELRLAQRRLSWEQVDYVLTNGTPVWRTGTLFQVLRRRDIAPADRRSAAITRLEGAVVVMDNNRIITVYRNRHSYRDICRKQTYDRHTGRREEGIAA